MFVDDFSSPPAESHGSDTPVAARERRVLGPDGREWRVREAPLPAFDRRKGYCLIFEAVGAARRVREYPHDWFTMPDAELYALSVEMPRRIS